MARVETYDILIIGSGAAGLRAAVEAAGSGARVGVLSKGSPGKKTATIFSGGVMAGSAPGASTHRHRARTLKAGRGINQPELVDTLVAEGPERLAELMDWGIEAEFHRGYLFARGRPPLWGEAIVDCLVSRCSREAIDFCADQVVTRLLPLQPGFAATAFSTATGGFSSFRAKAVVLATGGAAALYARHDNPGRMLGDGWLLALEAGAALQDLEFVQFYPLGLFEPGLPPFLIPPRLADRGRLVDQSDRDIHAKYDITERPAGEKARDKLSQALFREVYRDRGSVRLDVRKVSDAEWCEDPFSASTVALFGERYGARHRPVRVAPLAHHTMGGVVIDANGATAADGLFAAGEVTGGLHGANRMGGNALTETLVFGRRAGRAAAAHAGEVSDNRMVGVDKSADTTVGLVRGAEGPLLENPPEELAALRKMMWAHGGIIRTGEDLSRLIKAGSEISSAAVRSRLPDDPQKALQIIELRVAARAAGLILASALKRTESRGAHYREDYPEPNDSAWRGHLQVRQVGAGDLEWRFQPLK